MLHLITVLGWSIAAVLSALTIRRIVRNERHRAESDPNAKLLIAALSALIVIAVGVLMYVGITR